MPLWSPMAVVSEMAALAVNVGAGSTMSPFPLHASSGEGADIASPLPGKAERGHPNAAISFNGPKGNFRREGPPGEDTDPDRTLPLRVVSPEVY